MLKKLVIFILAVASSEAENCTSSYNQKLYEELNCVPKNLQGDRCPTAWSCRQFWNRPKNKCFLDGKLYKTGAVEITGLEQNCKFACYCSETQNKYRVNCAVPRCAGPASQDCISTYSEIDQCCSGWTCPPLSNITCTVESETYYEGERFSSNNCQTCLCTKEGIICQQDKCFSTLRYLDEIDAKCAPVFEKDGCCPISFKSPSEYDVFIKNMPSTSSKQKCYYGNSTYDLNSAFINLEEFVYCTCNQPPLFTCFGII